MDDRDLSSQEHVLAIDLGTSGPKVTLVTIDGRVVAYEREHTALYLLPEGGAEQDPADWLAAIRRAAQRLLAGRPELANSVVAISCTSQWAGTVAVDRQGQPLMNALIWMDARGAPHVEEICGGPMKVSGYGLNRVLTWIRLTGGAPALSGKDPIAHILYIKEHCPEIYRQTYKFLEPLDYVNMYLTGKFAASYHSITLHWLTDNRAIDRVEYDARLLKMATIDREKLPDLEQGTHVLGVLRPEVAADLGLSEDVQVVMGAPDLHAAAIGSGAVNDYAGNLYIGTSSWITCHVPFKKLDLQHMIGSFPAAVPGRYMVTNEQEMAGACLDYLRDNILRPDQALEGGSGKRTTYELLEQMARAAPPGSQGLIFTPWLNGERTPVDDHLIRGGFHNLSLQHKRSHLVRAVLEGVAYNTRWLLHCVENFARRPLESLRVSGGGAKSDLWCQILADVLKKPVLQVADPIQATSRGAALLAFVAMGHLTFDDVAKHTEVARTFVPDGDNASLYDHLYEEFLQLYRHNKDICHRLNSHANRQPTMVQSGRVQ